MIEIIIIIRGNPAFMHFLGWFIVTLELQSDQ